MNKQSEIQDKAYGFDRKRFRTDAAGGIAIPCREQILDYLAASRKPVSVKQVAQAAALPDKYGYQALAGRLQRMQERGLVEFRKSGYCIPRGVELKRGTVIGHPDGYGFLDIGDEQDLYLPFRQMRNVLHGDRILVRVRQHRRKSAKDLSERSGVFIELLSDSQRILVCRLVKDRPRGGECASPRWLARSVDQRISHAFALDTPPADGLREQDVVLLAVTRHPASGIPCGRIEQWIGHVEDADIDVKVAIANHDIPYKWSEGVEQELAALGEDLFEVTLSPSRADLRSRPFVTIDGKDAKDFDDAVFAERTGQGWRLFVGIADVSEYVARDSALDRDALQRGNSVYFPGSVVPMLPEALSNGICSLNPHVDRNCMICEMEVSQTGQLLEYQFYPALIRSQARLTYEFVDAVISGNKDIPDSAEFNINAEVLSNLQTLYALSLKLRKQKEHGGAIDFSLLEPEIIFSREGQVAAIRPVPRTEAHRLIEECMLAANVCAAGFLQKHFANLAIYRNHPGPSSDSLKALRPVLKTMGLTLDGGDLPRAGHYARLIRQVADQEEVFETVQQMLLRTLGQANYGISCEGHFALAFPRYTHFTSPIRRYSDLVVHRLIKLALNIDKTSATMAGFDSGFLQGIAEHCSMTERRADEAVYEVLKAVRAKFMADKTGKRYPARITGVRDFGIFVQVENPLVDGLVHVSQIGSDYYEWNCAQQILTGRKTGRVFSTGQRLRVEVVAVDCEQMKIDFRVIDDEAQS